MRSAMGAVPPKLVAPLMVRSWALAAFVPEVDPMTRLVPWAVEPPTTVNAPESVLVAPPVEVPV